MSEIEKQFQDLLKEAEDKFPIIGKDLRAFNTSNTENVDYYRYLNLFDGKPLSTTSNQSNP